MAVVQLSEAFDILLGASLAPTGGPVAHLARFPSAHVREMNVPVFLPAVTMELVGRASYGVEPKPLAGPAPSSLKLQNMNKSIRSLMFRVRRLEHKRNIYAERPVCRTSAMASN